MQLASKTALAVKLILLTGLISACQPENMVTPSAPAPEPASAVSAELYQTNGSNTRITHKLTKHGNKNLLYYANGDIWKVVDSPIEYTEYVYNANTIVASHRKNSQLYSQIVYTLDANGRVLKSLNSSDKKTFKYEYNLNGQLVKRYNENAVNERNEYDYNGDGELSLFKTFDSANVKGLEITFGYTVPNEPLLMDQYPLSSSFLHPIDEYLPVFGQFSKHLVRRITYKACGNNDVVEYLINYKLNNDKLVIENSLINLVTNKLVSQTTWRYSGYYLLSAN